jgi:hypothetical protein
VPSGHDLADPTGQPSGPAPVEAEQQQGADDLVGPKPPTPPESLEAGMRRLVRHALTSRLPFATIMLHFRDNLKPVGQDGQEIFFFYPLHTRVRRSTFCRILDAEAHLNVSHTVTLEHTPST